MSQYLQSATVYKPWWINVTAWIVCVSFFLHQRELCSVHKALFGDLTSDQTCIKNFQVDARLPLTHWQQYIRNSTKGARSFWASKTTGANIIDIFNLFLTHANVPACLNSATAVLVSKQSNTSTLNDDTPVALTPVITKCFERLVLKAIKTTLPPDLDPDWCDYRANRPTDEAISTALTHLNQKGTCVKMLFLDYSSAFNTIICHILVHKLIDLNLCSPVCMWIQDFLSNHPRKLLSLLWLRKLNRDSTSSEPSRQQSVYRFAKALQPLHCWKHPHLENDCLVPKLHRPRQKCLQRVSKTSPKIISPWTTSSQHAVFERPAPSLKTTCTPPITASLCCHLGSTTGPLKSTHPGWKTPQKWTTASAWTALPTQNQITQTWEQKCDQYILSW